MTHRASRYRHEFVDELPDVLEPRVLYVSVVFSTAIHLCLCGCHSEIVTPITPTDWHLRFDGECVSLSPSIGNWSYKCRSHYFLRSGQVVWAGTDRQQRLCSDRDTAHESRSSAPVGRSWVGRLWGRLRGRAG